MHPALSSFGTLNRDRMALHPVWLRVSPNGRATCGGAADDSCIRSEEEFALVYHYPLIKVLRVDLLGGSSSSPSSSASSGVRRQEPQRMGESGIWAFFILILPLFGMLIYLIAPS